MEERQDTVILLRRAELLGVVFDQSKLHPTLDQTKSVGRTSSNMGGQTVAIGSHRYREVTGSNSVEVLNFSGFSSQLLKFASITARIIALLDFISAFQYVIHFIYHFVHSVEQSRIEQSWSVDSNFVLYFGQDFRVTLSNLSNMNLVKL